MIHLAVNQLIVANTGVSPTSSVAVVPVTDTVTTNLPKIIFNLISGPRTYNDSGSDGIVPARYQLDIFAATLLQAQNIADALRTNLDGWSGTKAGIQIIRVSFPESPTHRREQMVSGTNFNAGRVTVDMLVTYREPVVAGV